jgi:hypothetical protein
MLKIKLLMAALLAVGFASQTFAADDEATPKSKTHAKHADATHADAASTKADKGTKWTAQECNSHCDAKKCLTLSVLVDCSEKCKATPMQIWECTGNGYKKNCMKPDMSENIKNKDCEKISYALSAQAFKMWSLPVKSTASKEDKERANQAIKARREAAGHPVHKDLIKENTKFLNHLEYGDLVLPEVQAIMSREALASLKVSTIDTDNDTAVAAG